MILFDLEANGLLDTVHTIHCLCTLDTATNEIRRFRGVDIALHGLPYLAFMPAIGGHNIIKYDLPALEKVYGWHYGGAVYDTLVASRLAFADLEDGDHRKWFKKGTPYAKLAGSHGLKAWGIRLGCLKGSYVDDTENCWDAWSEQMEDYCEQDVKVTFALWSLLEKQNLTPLSLWLEHEFCTVIVRQERRGVAFARQTAEALYVDLLDQREKAAEKLREEFGWWFAPTKTFTPKQDNKRYGYRKGCALTKLKRVEFNPGSRKHIARCLKRRHGWQPRVLTETGEPKVDEKVISKLPYPEVPLILDYLLLNKLLGMLALGDNAWLKLENGGRIYGSVNTGGAVTGRCTHSRPNLAQVPKVGKPYGKECRSLFVPSPGMTLVGCDASALELRCLAHYMARWDKGNYAEVVISGKQEDASDIHSVNQRAAGLPTRDSAKTFILTIG